MIKIYRKTATIKAEQFDGGQKRVFGYRVIPSSMIDAITGMPAYYLILINDVKPEPDDDFPVDDVEVVFEVGDWIIKEPDEIKAINNDLFKKSYAELPAIPQAVAKYIEMTRDEVMLFDALDAVLSGFGTLPDWISSNQDLFARAWLDGYVVEEDK